MRWFLSIAFLFLTCPVFSQEDLAVLAKQLTASSSTEKAKVTAIFRWITENIAYRPNSLRAVIGPASLRNSREEVIDDSPLKPLNERVAESVVDKREAVCDGYARLFTFLCEAAGIRSEIIIGYARTSTNKPGQRFGVNHYWNAVMIDGDWQLLDATWASGYLSSRNEFIREYDDRYFLSSPENFIRDHYPDDPRWTLLPDSKVPEEFRRSPFKQKSFSKYRITSFYPSSGVIETFVGDTVHLQLETAATELGRNVSPDMLVDSTMFSHSASWIFLKPDPNASTGRQNRYNYSYTVASPDIAWIYLLYNDDLVLRYKVHVKRRGS
ncbi:MAG: transglutaminase domain-containing protein [Chitinophagaceae bacterium]